MRLPLPKNSMTQQTAIRYPMVWMIAVVFLLWLKAWLTANTDLGMHFDEAQYWTWSQHLDWGYYSKGPLVAWLIALSEWCFGHGEWQTRLPGWLCHLAFLGIIYRLSYDLWQDRSAAYWALGIALFSPLYFTLGLAMTTDILLLTAWSATLWAIYHAVFRNQPQGWYWAGLAVGLGALAKLTIVLLWILMLLVLFSQRSSRYTLWVQRRAVLTSGMITLLLLAPFIIWNIQHDWVTFHHSATHVAVRDRSLSQMAIFLLGQIIILSPFLFGVILSLFYRPPPRGVQYFLWSLSVWITGLFILKSWIGDVQPNWPAPSYIGFIILLAGYLDALKAWLKRWLVITLAIYALLTGWVLFWPQFLGVPLARAPFKELRGWHETVHQVRSRLPQVDFLMFPAYTLATPIAFYWPEKIATYLLPSKERRLSQFDLWPGLEQEAGKTGSYIGSTPPPMLLSQACHPLEEQTPLIIRLADGSIRHTLYLAICHRYQPVSWDKPQHF